MIHLYDIREKAKLEGQKTDHRLPGAGDREGGEQERILGGDTLLYLDWVGGYTTGQNS